MRHQGHRHSKRRLSPLFRSLNSIQLREEETAVAQMRRLGFRSEDVRHIVVMHLHFDGGSGSAVILPCNRALTAAHMPGSSPPDPDILPQHGWREGRKNLNDVTLQMVAVGGPARPTPPTLLSWTGIAPGDRGTVESVGGASH